jgi:hypothetical protein
MFDNQELIKLCSNDQKRKAFIQDYKAWGVWFTQPELGLTFYKYDLPDCSRLIAMEYLRAPYPHEKTDCVGSSVTCSKHYLQLGSYFNPSAASVYQITDRLKALKEKLVKDQRPNARSTVYGMEASDV